MDFQIKGKSIQFENEIQKTLIMIGFGNKTRAQKEICSLFNRVLTYLLMRNYLCEMVKKFETCVYKIFLKGVESR